MAIFEKVKIKNKSISEYGELTPRINHLIEAVGPGIEKLPVIHLNSVQTGGGVAELLQSQVPLEQSIGLNSNWYTISKANIRFFEITKKIHNLLQGQPGHLTYAEQNEYLKINHQLGHSLSYILRNHKNGIIIAHDPQVLPAINYIDTVKFKALFRLHVDISAPNAGALSLIESFLSRYDAVLVSAPDYANSLHIKKSKLRVVLPAIDPFSVKNRDLNVEAALQKLQTLGIDTNNPLVTQVSRFDRWKDPLGVIYAYKYARGKIPNIVLILAGPSVVADDPEAHSILTTVKKAAKNDPGIHILSGDDNLLVNALYTASDIILQKSIKEGFGLTITEAMWKGKPVISGNTVGGKMQIKNGSNGIIARSSIQAGQQIVDLLRSPAKCRKLGLAAQQSVKKNFLMSRLLLDHLKIYQYMATTPLPTQNESLRKRQSL